MHRSQRHRASAIRRDPCRAALWCPGLASYIRQSDRVVALQTAAPGLVAGRYQGWWLAGPAEPQGPLRAQYQGCDGGPWHLGCTQDSAWAQLFGDAVRLGMTLDLVRSSIECPFLQSRYPRWCHLDTSAGVWLVLQRAHGVVETAVAATRPAWRQPGCRPGLRAGRTDGAAGRLFDRWVDWQLAARLSHLAE